MPLWWHVMRDAAILRHKLLHIMLEDADPNKWPAHEFWIACVYGR